MAVKVRPQDIPMGARSIKLDLSTSSEGSIQEGGIHMLAMQAVSHESVEGARIAVVLIVLAALFLRRQVLLAVFGVMVILAVVATVVGLVAVLHFIGL
jgi:hypothetical protein